MASVNDLILAEVKDMRTEIGELKVDVGILNSKHDNGNRSERVGVWVASTAAVISLIALVMTLGNFKGEHSCEATIIKNVKSERAGFNPVELYRKIQPKEKHIPSGDDGIEKSPSADSDTTTD